MPSRFGTMTAIASASLLLSACGGSGSGAAELVSSPPPAPSPAPTPPPTPASQPPFGTSTDTQFPTAGDDWEIRYDVSANTYEVRPPNKDWERLQPYASSGTEYYAPDSTYGIYLTGDAKYQYTRRATVFENGFGFTIGEFTFGLPTPAGGVPTTGSATYSADIWGTGTTSALAAGQYYEVTGTAKLSFDFGAGTLSGSMLPTLTGPSGKFSAPQYDFTSTVYSVGSASFSGRLATPGLPGESSIQGRFTGPNAEELMAEWTAPFVDPLTPGQQAGSMRGHLIGKND